MARKIIECPPDDDPGAWAAAWKKATFSKNARADHPYLIRNGFKTIGKECYDIKQDGNELIIPMYSLRSRTILFRAYQYIKPDGTKGFAEGIRDISGVFAIPRAWPREDFKIKNGVKDVFKPIIICSEWVLGRSIRDATYDTVLVAGSRAELLPVARIIKKRFYRPIIIVGEEPEYDIAREVSAEVVTLTMSAVVEEIRLATRQATWPRSLNK